MKIKRIAAVLAACCLLPVSAWAAEEVPEIQKCPEGVITHEMVLVANTGPLVAMSEAPGGALIVNEKAVSLLKLNGDITEVISFQTLEEQFLKEGETLRFCKPYYDIYTNRNYLYVTADNKETYETRTLLLLLLSDGLEQVMESDLELVNFMFFTDGTPVARNSDQLYRIVNGKPELYLDFSGGKRMTGVKLHTSEMVMRNDTLYAYSFTKFYKFNTQTMQFEQMPAAWDSTFAYANYCLHFPGPDGIWIKPTSGWNANAFTADGIQKEIFKTANVLNAKINTKERYHFANEDGTILFFEGMGDKGNVYMVRKIS